MRVPVEAHILLRKLHPALQESTEWQEQLIAELRGRTPNLTASLGRRPESLEAGVADPEPRWRKALTPPGVLAWPCTLLTLRGHATLLLKEAERAITAMDPPEDRLGAMDLACCGLSGDLTNAIGDLILASAIASPGALSPMGSICLIQERQYELPKYYSPSGLELVRAEAAERGWPALGTVPLQAAMTWLEKVPGFGSGTPKGPTGRAVSALSRLLGFDPEKAPGERLMWCMVALEAVFGRGGGSVSDQLIGKMEALIGGARARHNQLRTLYSYRSRFVHGELDSPLAYSPYDGNPSYQRAIGEAERSESIAEALLLATLQAMVTKDLIDPTFRYALTEG